jgi:hypothetical protein
VDTADRDLRSDRVVPDPTNPQRFDAIGSRKSPTVSESNTNAPATTDDPETKNTSPALDVDSAGG